MHFSKLIFTSDTHLGGGDDAEDFSVDAEDAYRRLMDENPDAEFYGLGDMLDIWEAKESDIVAHHPGLIRAWQEKGDKFHLVPGNHDPDICIERLRETVTADEVVIEWKGHRILVLHGHQFDGPNKPGASLGRMATQILGWLERNVHGDIDFWANWLKHKLFKRLRQYDDDMVQRAQEKNCDIVVYGHTHVPCNQLIDNVLVLNCGCWTWRTERGYPYVEATRLFAGVKWIG